MIVKFFRRSKENGSAPINYLLGAKRDRKGARVFSGYPELTKNIINASRFEHKYKSGVLSFSEKSSEFTEQQKKDLTIEFEKTLFPGLEPDQYNVLWVEHSDKDGRLELNFLIPAVELRTGKRLQPYYKGTDQRRVNAWKNIVNHEMRTIDGKKLSDPNDPSRRRLNNKYIGTAPTPYDAPRKNKKDDKINDRDELRKWIDDEMIERHERNELRGRNCVIRALNQLGVTIERTVKSSITVSHPDVTDKNGKPQKIRLNGGMYASDYNPHLYTPVAQERYKNNASRRIIIERYEYENAMQIKKEQMQKEFGDAVVPPPLELKAPKHAQPIAQPKPATMPPRPKR